MRNILRFLVLAVVLAFALWNIFTWYRYPCAAFNSGYLSLDPLPGRCVRS